MKTIEIIGYKRANLTKAQLNQLRFEGSVPCVLYGGGLNLSFYSPVILFRDLIYTQEAAFVELNIEGQIYKAIKQDIQFHPVNEMIMHVDFLLLEETKEVKMEIPVRLTGSAVGVSKGGRLVQRLQKLQVKALPKYMPEVIELDITNLDVQRSARVGEIKTENYTILKAASVPVASVEITRAMKSTEATAETAEAAK